MLPATFRCPRCKCHALYITRRKGLDWLMSAIGLRPVRCMTCDKRFYLRYSRVREYDPDARGRTFTRKHSNAGRESGRAA